MTSLLLTLAVALAAPDDLSPRDPDAADLQRMQGDWMVATMKVNGTVLTDDEARVLFRTIAGNNYTISRFSKPIASGTFTIDATATPRTIDSTPAGSPDGKPLLGIYEFDGDKLRICNAPPGKPRPKDFEARLGSQHSLIVWEPEKVE